MLRQAPAGEAGDVQLQGIGGLPVPVDDEDVELVPVQRGGGVDEGQALMGEILGIVVHRVAGDIEGIAAEPAAEGHAPAPLHELDEGVVSAAPPHVIPVGGGQSAQAPGHAAHLHPVRVTQEGQEDPGVGERVHHIPHAPAGAEVGHLIRIMADILPVRAELVMGPVQVMGPVTRGDGSMGPGHDPVLIEGEHHLPGGAALRLHEVAQGDLRIDVILKKYAAAQQGRPVSQGGGMIMVQGDVVHRLVALLQHLKIPLGIVAQEGGGGDADGGLDGAVHPFHGLGGLQGPDAVAPGIPLPGGDLPGAVHLVAQVPELHPIRLLVAVFHPFLFIKVNKNN